MKYDVKVCIFSSLCIKDELRDFRREGKTEIILYLIRNLEVY